MLPVAILAGGLATRLRPITEKIPKALVEVAGKPFVFHQLDWLQRQKVDRVVLCVGYLSEMIREQVGSGERWGIEVKYSLDGEKLLGTGGALKKAMPLLGKEFFVFYGDSFLPIDFLPVQEAFRASGRPALMTFLRNQGRWDRSNVEASDGKLIAYNKREPTSDMEHIDYGLGVLSVGVLKGRGGDEPFDLAELYQDLARRGDLAGHEVIHRFYEIGSKEGLAETEKFLGSRIL
jgi:NDP-sugar pyrophosphorylase family protein